jgi:hypothetical protein
METTTTTGPRPIHAIARDIARVWGAQGSGVYFGAVPYLRAMSTMQSAREAYGYDSGESIVLYFLSNAKTFRGPEARTLKAELKAALASAGV